MWKNRAHLQAKNILIIVISIFIVVAIFIIQQKNKTPDSKQEVTPCLSLETKSQLSCINEGLKKISGTQGEKTALDVIEPISQQHTYLLDWSHAFAHTIGTSAIAAHRSDDQTLEQQIGKALVECDGYGAFGCYHGVIEAGLAILPVEKRASVIRESCLENPLIQEKQYFVNQCLHWFGHGVGIFSNLTLNQALEMCNKLNTN